MRPAQTRRVSNSKSAILIEGYASLFGVEDQSGDVVRAGAFAHRPPDARIPMLLQHKSGAVVGRWTRLVEDGRGLFVRGLIETKAGRVMVASGWTGLSIGFRPKLWTERPGSGRHLIKIDLVEISLVASPMLTAARFETV